MSRIGPAQPYDVAVRSLLRQIESRFGLTAADARSIIRIHSRSPALIIQTILATALLAPVLGIPMGLLLLWALHRLDLSAGPQLFQIGATIVGGAIGGLVAGLASRSLTLAAIAATAADNRCLRCTYDLTGTTAPPADTRRTCPECGLPNPPPPS